MNNNDIHVLLVEDDRITQKFTCTFLKQTNCKVTVAETAKDALDLSFAYIYQLIFMDIGLPDQDGFFVASNIRNGLLSKNKHTPIIALTAHTTQEYIEQSKISGMNDFVEKPLSIAKIKKILKLYCNVNAF